MAIAKRDALSRWDAALNTPWTNYQLQLAINEVDYANSIKTIEDAHVVAVADAAKVRAEAEADADHARDIALANLRETNTTAANADLHQFNQEQSNNQFDFDQKSIDERKKLSDKLAEEYEILALASAQAGYDYAMAVASASHSYATTMISARRLDRGVKPSTAASAGAAYAIAVNNAFRALRIANITAGAAWGEAARGAYSDFVTAMHDAEKERRNSNAEDQRTHSDSVADSQETMSVESVRIEGVRTKAYTAAYVVYVTTVAPADKTFFDASVQHVGILHVDDANDLKSYYQDESAEYKVAMDNWHSSVNSPWTAYHVNKGTVEQNWAAKAGLAAVHFAQANRDANNNRQTAISTVDKDDRIAIVNAYQVQQDEIVDQTLTFVTAIADAHNDSQKDRNEIAERDKKKESDRNELTFHEERDFYDQHVNDAANAEKDFLIASINFNTDYSNASIQASADMAGAIGDSWEAYNYDEIEWSEHQSNVETAVDDYNTAMQTATDDYNAAGRAATDALWDARKDLYSSFHEHMAKNPNAKKQSRKSADDKGLIQDRGTSDRDLSAAILAAVTQLVTDRGNTDKTYSTTVNNLELSSNITRTNAQNAHRHATVSAAGELDRENYIADAERREDEIAYRGIYESDLHTVYASAKAVIAAATGTPFAIAEADAAAADRDFSIASSIARNAYEDAISIAELRRLTSTNTADVNHVGDVNVARLTYAQTVTPAYVAYDNATYNAAIDVGVTNTIAEAEYQKALVDAQTKFNDAAADARATRDAGLAGAADDYGTTVGGLYDDLYTDHAPDTWVDRVWTDISAENYYYYGYYGGFYYGGYYGGFYGGYGGYFGGYGYYGGYGGYYGGYGGYFGGFGGYYGGYGGYGGYYGGYGYYYGAAAFYGGYRGYYGGYFGSLAFGYGFIPNGSQAGSEDFNSGLDAANQQLRDDTDAALSDHATAIGDANITRVTEIADARISLIATYGTSAVTYATAVNTATSALESATEAANLARATSEAVASRVHSDDVANADQVLVIDRGNADTAYSLALITPTATHAGGLAQAEAGYHQNTAMVDAARAQAVAIATGDDEDVFQSVCADAKVGWFSDVGPVFVARAFTQGGAKAQENHDLALAAQQRDLLFAGADETYANSTAMQTQVLAIALAGQAKTLADGLLPLENTRRLDDAQFEADFANQVADLQKTRDIDIATAQKTRDVDRVNDPNSGSMDGSGMPGGDDPIEEAYREAVADAEMGFAKGFAAKELIWANANTLSKSTYVTQSVPKDHTFATNSATAKQTYHDQIASQTKIKRDAKIDAEKTYRDAKTVARNIMRTTSANADATLGVAMESARVTAHTDIDNQVQIPWTDYLVTIANAQLTAANDTATAYIALANNRNTAETTYANTINPAFVTREKGISAAVETHAIGVNAANKNSSDARANALRDLYLNLNTELKTYRDSIAKSVHDHKESVAQIERDYIVDEDATKRNTDLAAANDTLDSERETAEDAWLAAEATEHAGLYIDYATAIKDYRVDVAGKNETLATAKNNFHQSYKTTESNAYLAIATTWANSDAGFYQAEANALANATSGSSDPWMMYDAAMASAMASRVATTTNAARDRAITGATAQRNTENIINSADTTRKNTLLAIDSALESLMANIDLALETSKANAYAATAGEGNALPELDESPDVILNEQELLKIEASTGAFDPMYWAAVADDVIERMKEWELDAWETWTSFFYPINGDLTTIAEFDPIVSDELANTVVIQSAENDFPDENAPAPNPMIPPRDEVPTVQDAVEDLKSEFQPDGEDSPGLTWDQDFETESDSAIANEEAELPDLKNLTKEQFSHAVAGATYQSTAHNSSGNVTGYYVPLVLSNGEKYGAIFKRSFSNGYRGPGFTTYSFVRMVPGGLNAKTALPQNLWVASAIRCCFHQRILDDLADFLVADCDGDFQ